MAKLSNMLVMVNLLNSGRKYSVSELSSYLEVSERVIREYKLFLEEAGIYIDTIRGPYGGYVLNQDMFMPNLLFNEDDIEVLNKCLSKEKNNEIIDKINIIKDKINFEIINHQNRNAKILTDNEEIKKYNLFSKAIKYNIKAKIGYHNLKKGYSERIVYPLSLYLLKGEWWCSCFWEEKEDMRQFHLKRITNIELLDENFNIEKLNIIF